MNPPASSHTASIDRRRAAPVAVFRPGSPFLSSVSNCGRRAGLVALLLCLPACSFEIPATSCGATCVQQDGGGDMTPAQAGPGQMGPLRVASFKLDVPVTGPLGTVPVTIYGPGADAMTLHKGGAPYPLVLFSPGLSIPGDQYIRLSTHLASHGVMIAVQTPRAEWSHTDYRDDGAAVVRWLMKPVGQGAERVRDFVDGTKVAVAGHGLGAKIAVLMAARTLGQGDVPLVAAALLDPVDSPGLGVPLSAVAEVARVRLPLGVPILLVGEAQSRMGMGSCPSPGGNHDAIYGAAPSPAVSVTVLRGGYGDFVDDPQSCAACKTCPAGAEPRQTRDLSWKYLAAYFLWTLKGEAAMADYLTGGAFEKDREAGLVTQAVK